MKTRILLILSTFYCCSSLFAEEVTCSGNRGKIPVLASMRGGFVDSGIVMRPNPSGTMWSGQFVIKVSDTRVSDPNSDVVDTLTGFEAIPTNGASCGLEVTLGSGQILSTTIVPGSTASLTWIIFASAYNSFDNITYTFHFKTGGFDDIMTSGSQVTWLGSSRVGRDQSSVSDYSVHNPFSTHTTVSFTLTKPASVRLQLFDVTGRTLREIERECNPGSNQIELDTRDVPPGCYWYVIQGGEWERRGKLVKL